ncbi:LexA/Signal peptidase [Rickenella mellea]|uniref:LexA/Signal peptidase n=1 Tax=Rickenella mellea TaxID=50990 RepID=A0A4Y7QMT2_9AGAM|nr:LexA/Signal peptidase [Rickenella mellea]
MFRNQILSTLRHGLGYCTKYPLTVALRLVQGFCVAHLFNEYVGGFRLVQGPSMMPTFSPNPEMRGDLVVAVSPRDPRALVCKRIIGLPGDVVCVDPTGEYAPSTEHVYVPKGHLWLMGDNASWSRDSRTYGPVPMALIRGIIVARVSRRPHV